jgi:hypothetical protein
MKPLIVATLIAVTSSLLGLVAAPTPAAAQSRYWQMKQGVYCPNGRRVMHPARCEYLARIAARRAAQRSW